MKNRIKVELIYKYIKDNNLSKTRFCKICKISPDIFNKIEMFNIYFEKTPKCYDFKLDVLFKIAKLLNIKLNELFENE